MATFRVVLESVTVGVGGAGRGAGAGGGGLVEAPEEASLVEAVACEG